MTRKVDKEKKEIKKEKKAEVNKEKTEKKVTRRGVSSSKKKGDVSEVKVKKTATKVAKPIVIKLKKEGLSPQEISEIIKQPVNKIIAELLSLGVIVSATQKITDRDTLELLFLQLGKKVVIEEVVEEVEELEKKQEPPKEPLKEEIKKEEIVKKEEAVDKKPEVVIPKKEIPPNYVKKIPVVTVMGHVDHGKTTLLDTIRKTNVAASEYGAITQHIGAYKVNYKGNFITFIDTPGHEAFSTIRARGAKVTDIVVLVVAGDEGIKQQTIECINHIREANVPFIVAINKIDLPQCNVNNVKKQFSEMGIVPSDWGGNVEFVEISARNNINIDKLLDVIVTQAELMGLYSPKDVPCEAVVIETKFDRKVGFLATVIVNKGKLKVGDNFVCGYSYGKVKTIYDENNQRLNELNVGEPGEIFGFEVPAVAGDILKVIANEKEFRKIIEEIETQKKLQLTKTKRYLTIEDIISGKSKVLTVVIKADTQGSLEAILKMLNSLSEELKGNPDLPELKIAHSSVGEIKESDVLLATASNAIIIGFNVRPNTQALKNAKHEGIEIRTYRLIYELVDDIRNILKRLEVKKEVEEFLGRARIKKIFEISKVGKVAGCVVEDGKIVRNAKVRILRDNIIIAETKIISLKRFKDDVKEVQQGYECGVALENFQNIKENDVIECYQIITK